MRPVPCMRQIPSCRCLILLLVAAFGAAALGAAGDPPDWAYPINPPNFTPRADDGAPRRVPDSTAGYTVTQLRDLFSAPVWHPDDHPPLPPIVAHGRKPAVFACGVCHRADGPGGPENANIAGLPAAYTQTAPLADHHQHLFSSVVAKAEGVKPIAVEDLISLLDAASIRRAVVLSVAYILGDPKSTAADEYEKVKAENEWTSAQVARFPDRLVGFCSINPLKPYALNELARCAKDPHLRRGLKLHFANSRVDYHNPVHIERLRQLFSAANGYGMAIIAHMRTSISAKIPYGADEARILLDEVIPAAPDVPIQIAHLAGAGGYRDPLIDQAISVFVDAIEKNDERAKNLYFDVTTVVLPMASAERLSLIATRLRQLGLQRILYGSDAASGGNLPPREGWAAFHRLPLTEAEFDIIARNVPPYMR
jgi:uncharacterized protein